jgi:hypothetical protein
MTGCCENGTEPLGPLKGGEFFPPVERLQAYKDLVTIIWPTHIFLGQLPRFPCPGASPFFSNKTFAQEMEQVSFQNLFKYLNQFRILFFM